MLNGDGGASLAVIARVKNTLKKSCELSGMLARKNISLKLKGKVYIYKYIYICSRCKWHKLWLQKVGKEWRTTE